MIQIIDFATGFGAPSESAWLKLVEKTLKGAGPETLISRTRDGIEIAPLYRDGPAAPVRKGPAADSARPWDIRATIRHPDPARANAQILEDLEGGASSVLVKIDPRGKSGVAVGSKDDLARVLNGVLLDIAPVAMNAGYLGPEVADWLGELTKGAPEAEPQFHLDPLTAFAQAGASPGPIESHLLHAANVAVRLGRAYPKAGLFIASGRIAHEAGGTEAQELAHAMACGIAYAKTLIRCGASPDQAFGAVVIGLSGAPDYFAAIAKLRAARILWAKLAIASGAEAVPARIEVRSSHRMLTALDPWTNMLRLASAAFGAGVGGADAIVLGSFTDALDGLPTTFSRRQARNTQLVLMEEAHIARVADPAGGAWFLETLTDEMARAAWAKFRAIEAAGGI
ncbi:MAG: methylmalonyl-CoA mutase family protein, partial [Alphaproteobacteria bacterium]